MDTFRRFTTESGLPVAIHRLKSQNNSPRRLNFDIIKACPTFGETNLGINSRRSKRREEEEEQSRTISGIIINPAETQRDPKSGTK